MNRVSPSSIEVRELSKSFGTVKALDGVSFTVEQGELFFLLGPSGCGKTTMLRILAGLESPDSGEVLFSGKNVADLPPHRRGAPMVFQNYALWPHLTVKDNVAFGLVERRVPRAQREKLVTQALSRVGLSGYENRKPSQLSGGQQQRVVLARALVLDPKVILLDEPLSNLDAKLRTEMREEIKRLHHETKLTFVYVTHDQSEALSLADRLGVMRDGRISAMGTPLDLYHRPPNLFCADFLGESNLLPGTVVEVADNIIRTQTNVGVLDCTDYSSHAYAKGERVTCLIRPERLRPSQDRQPGMNLINAKVLSLSPLGPTLTATLTAQKTELKAALLNAYPVPVRPGDTVEWEVERESTVVLPESEEA